MRARHFDRVGEDRYGLRPDLRARVSFHHLSAQEHLAVLGGRSIDVILFQNVGVYLAPDAVRDIHAQFGRVLREDGLLIQAATDPSPDRRLFRPVSTPGLPVYGQASRADRAPGRGRDAAPAPRPRAGGEPASGGAPLPLLLRGNGGFKDAELDAIASLAAERREEEALKAATRLTEARPRDKAPLFLRAQLLLAGGRTSEAITDLRGVVFLAPDDHIGRYWYAMVLAEAGQLAAALGQLRRLLSELEKLPPPSLLSDGLTTAQELAAAGGFLRKQIE
jgi:tetratricopeptide (TPR) repeat protein